MYTAFYGLTFLGGVIDLFILTVVLSLVAFEYYAFTALLIICIPAIMFYMSGVGISDGLTYLTANWPYLLMYIGGYIGIGVLYSIFKWDRFMKASVPEMQRLYSKYTSPNSTHSFLSDSEIREMVAREVGQRKSIESWIVYWPFHLFNGLAKTILVDLISHIVQYFGNIYNAITKRYISQLK